MGNVEQDLARYQREVDDAEDAAETLAAANHAIRDEITGDVDAVSECLVLALEKDCLQLAWIAWLMVAVRDGRTKDAAAATAALYDAIEPYVGARARRLAPERVKLWRRQAEEARAEAILESRNANLYGPP